MAFTFKCISCNEVHTGMPTFGANAPTSYYDIAPENRNERCLLGSDDCIIDDKFYFIRGCIEIPVHGEIEPFIWGVWVSVSKESHLVWEEYFGKEKRSHIAPFFGWFNSWLEPYPDTLNLKTTITFRDKGIRPLIELQPSDHPLYIEQHNGITVQRVAELYARVMHEKA